MILGDTSTHNSHFVGKSLSPHLETSKSSHMEAESWITSDNPISMWLWRIWNSTFWLRVENLKKYREYGNTRYEYVPNTSVGKRLFISYFCSLFITHSLRSKQSLRHLLCFNFRCEDIIRIYPRRKTKSDQWLGKYYCTLGRIWTKQGVSKQVWFVPKTAGRLGVVVAVQP